MSNAEINTSILPERTEPALNHTVLTGPEFLKDFSIEVQRAEKRVWGQAMAIYPSQSLFLDAIRAANEKGLDTRLNVDWFTLLVSEGGINALIGPKKIIGKGSQHESLREYDRVAYRSLKDSGVMLHFTNPPTLREKVFPYTGRNHIKIYIVDSVGYIGGINIQDDSIRGIDFVVKITDPRIVDVLAEEFEFGSDEKKDDEVLFTDGSILIDGGKPGESTILEAAQHMVDLAQKKVRNISFFTPDGPFLKSLKKAHDRGVDVEILKPSETSGIYVLLDLFNKINMNIKGRKVPFRETQDSVHAKLLIVDDETVLFGSHNLMASGVNAGTQEIAFFSSNPILVGNLINFYNKARNGEFRK